MLQMFGKNSRFELTEKFFKREQFHKNLRKYARMKPKSWNPDITISRDPGSGGRHVARHVAKKLGWNYYDKRILKKLAEQMGYDEHIIAAVDEHPRSSGMDIFHSLFNPNYISDYDYIKSLKKLLRTAGREEDAVFLGRGANHIIPKNKALHVRITAPFESRVANTAKYEKMTHESARTTTLKRENKRNAFIRQYFGCDPNCPDYFDLVLNTEQLSLNAARDIIIASFKRKFPNRK